MSESLDEDVFVLQGQVESLAAGGKVMAEAVTELTRRVGLLEDTVANLGGTVVGIVETAVAARSLETSKIKQVAKRVDL
jgi:hypothetical protein